MTGDAAPRHPLPGETPLDTTKKIIRDGNGRKLVLEELIGVGTFGKVFLARSEEPGGPVYAAKLPLAAEDLARTTAHAAEIPALSARMIRGLSQRRLPDGLGVRTFGVVDGGGAIPCLLMEHLPGSLHEVLRKDVHFVELVGTLGALCRALAPLHEAGLAHGNVKPGNVFVLGEDDWRLTDPLPDGGKILGEALTTLPGWAERAAPELLAEPDGSALLKNPSLDTFAVGKIFYQAIVSPGSLADPRDIGGLAPGAADKRQLELFQDALRERFDQDDGNPHTRDLFLRRTLALITRVLSQETAPSPPFRFYSALELATRLEELRTLFHPGFEQLGPIVLDRPPGNLAFIEGEDVRFTLSFKCQGGLTDPDLLNCFIYVRDLEKQHKVRDLAQEVLPVHDGSRFRCAFTLRGLPPGQYLVRVGLGLKGSPGKPIPRDVMVEIRERPEAPVLAPLRLADPPAELPLLSAQPEVDLHPEEDGPAAPAARAPAPERELGEELLHPLPDEEPAASPRPARAPYVRPATRPDAEGARAPAGPSSGEHARPVIRQGTPRPAEQARPSAPRPAVAPVPAPPKPRAAPIFRDPTVRQASETRKGAREEGAEGGAEGSGDEGFHPELYYRQERAGIAGTPSDLIAQGGGIPSPRTMIIAGVLFVVVLLVISYVMWMGSS